MFASLASTSVAQSSAANQTIQSESPRQLKLDAVSKLGQLSTDDRRLQQIISHATEAISQSLSDKGQELFLDSHRILPPPAGKKVFDHEKRAITHLLEVINKKDTPENIRSVLQEVVDDLVEADRQIAHLSIAAAGQLIQAGYSSERKLSQAQRDFERAIQEEDPRKAIDSFKRAWENSQDAAGDNGLGIAAYEDVPDPFSSSLTESKLVVTFHVLKEIGRDDDDEGDEDDEEGRRRGDGDDENRRQNDDDEEDNEDEEGNGHEDDDDEDENEGSRRFVLELVQVIQDSSGATVRTLTSSQEVTVPPAGLDVTLMTAWDGMTDEGIQASDGPYTYLAFGKLLDPRGNNDDGGEADEGDDDEESDERRDSNNERLKAIAFPVLGSVFLDSTPPVITASVKPTANAADWHNTDVEVSFDAADSGSGVASTTPALLVTTEGAGQLITGATTDKAGNSTSTAVILNIDKTPPAIEITSPPDGTAQTVPDVTITGSVSDSLSGIDSVTCNGVPASVLNSDFTCQLTLSEGPNLIAAEAIDLAGNTNLTTITLHQVSIPEVSITSPPNLHFTNTTTITVTGMVDTSVISVEVNGVPAALTSSTFSADVPLQEGNNTITAVARNSAGKAGTSSIQVTLDTTAPRVNIDSPPDGLTTSAALVTVAGMINDIVVGTVNGDQASVTVNGVTANVANRSFLAVDVPLTPGPNTITAVGTDKAGNTASASITVHFQQIIGTPLISLVSGNNQTGTIGSPLTDPLVVELTDGNGNPAPGETVIFKVIENNGMLRNGTAQDARSIAVHTDSQGLAQAHWTLGTRAGAGNNIVEAKAVGFSGMAIFTATATSAPADKISLDAGNNQTGAIGQPLPAPFVAIVTDAGHNRLHNVPVTFTVLQGGGSFSGQPSITVNTDTDGRALAVLTLGPDPGIGNNTVEASFPGNQGFPATFVASGATVGDPADTSVSGVVLDNTDQPIEGVTVRIGGTSLETQTDDQGQFLLRSVPVGHIDIFVDASTIQRPGAWPDMHYELVTVAGQDNTIGMPVYLLPLDVPNGLFVDEDTGGTLTLPEVPGFSLTVAPGSATFPNGSKSGIVSVTVVHADKIPMTPNFGQQPRFVVTIQPAGVHFDPPAPITIPNVDGMAPGEVTEMYSFDHDLGSFVSIGTGTVSEDGTVVASDPGVGIIKGGWHCGGNPSSTGSAQNAFVNVISVSENSIQLEETVTIVVEGGPTPGSFTRIDWDSASLVQSNVQDVGSALRLDLELSATGPNDIEIEIEYTCPSGAKAQESLRIRVCPLVRVASPSFEGEVIADIEFVDSLRRIAQHAANNNVRLLITSSFRQTGTVIDDPVVPPATRSNHLAGHAIDMNVRYGPNNALCNSVCLGGTNPPQDVRNFIDSIRNDSGLRWGGDFSTPDPVHIDDGLNQNLEAWRERQNLAQRDPFCYLNNPVIRIN